MNRERLKELLLRFEDLRLQVYDDATGEAIVPGSVVNGHPTIGVGRCLDSYGITELEAAALFSADVDRVLNECMRFPWFQRLSPVRQEVIACMVFQLGYFGVRRFSKMCEALEAGDWPLAAYEMRASRWYAQTPKRAETLIRMMLTDQYQ